MGNIDWSAGPVFGEASGSPPPAYSGGDTPMYDIDTGVAGAFVGGLFNIFGEPGSGVGTGLDPSTYAGNYPTLDLGLDYSGAVNQDTPAVNQDTPAPPADTLADSALATADYIQGLPEATGEAFGSMTEAFGSGFGAGIQKALTGAITPLAEAPGQLTSGLANAGTLALLALAAMVVLK